LLKDSYPKTNNKTVHTHQSNINVYYGEARALYKTRGLTHAYSFHMA